MFTGFHPSQDTSDKASAFSIRPVRTFPIPAKIKHKKSKKRKKQAKPPYYQLPQSLHPVDLQYLALLNSTISELGKTNERLILLLEHSMSLPTPLNIVVANYADEEENP